MTSVFVGDRGPKKVSMSMATIAPTVTSVRVFVTDPNGTKTEWSTENFDFTDGVVSFDHVLAELTDDFPTEGNYTARAWFFDGPTFVTDSVEQTFYVPLPAVGWSI